jgi:hypothetical protein
MKRTLFSLACVLVFVVFTAIAGKPASTPLIIAWGENSPEWNQSLHLSAVRIGCSDAPASCVQYADQIAGSQRVSAVFVAILMKPANVAAYSATFGNLALSHPNLAEVGFDDFVSQAEKTNLGPAELSSLLEAVTTNLRTRGSKLQFGITVYQDQLGGEVDRLQLSDAVRQSVDFVHLYPHYRKERKSVTDYIADAKRAFPNAKIILGNYAYDRREYLPCSQGSQTRCSNDEEVNLFDQNFRADLQIVNTGAAAGIEFFPGNFGMEDAWKGWNSSRACKQDERTVCVQNTVAMREKVRQAMANAGR